MQTANQKSECPTWDAFLNECFEPLAPAKKEELKAKLCQALGRADAFAYLSTFDCKKP